MFSSKHIIKRLLLLIILVLFFLTGWSYNRNNQFNQQEVQMQQAPNQAQRKLDNRIKINNAAVGKIRQLTGIRQVNVVVMLNCAYVAVDLDTNREQLTYDMENQIAHQVHLTSPTISRVNVSTHPDFVEFLNTYVKNVELGKSDDDFIEKFIDIADKNFPKYR